MNSLVVSIVVWNNPNDALECADSLLRQTISDQLQILFVDNASNSETLECLKKYMREKDDSRLVLIQTGYNGGTACGFTAAARWAESHGVEYVGSLNADAVADKTWCEALLRELEDFPDAGIVTCGVLDRSGEVIDTTGEFYNTWGTPGPRDRGKPVSKLPAKPGYIFGATGGAYVCRTSIYKTVGYYDKKMFMYYEDIDFSFRAQLYGYKVRYSSRATVYHKRGASSDTVPGLAIYNTFKNLPLLFWKNVPLRLFPTILPRFLLAYHLIFFNAIVHGRGWSALKGYVMSLVLFPYGLKQRRKIQRTASVSPEYISSIILHDIPPDQTGLRKFRKFFTGKA